MLGFFLVSGRRSRRDQTGDDDDGGTPKTQPVPAMDASEGSPRGVRHTVVAEEDHTGDPIPQMPTNTDDAAQAPGNPLQQISPAQWVIAAVVLIAVPVVAYLGTFYLYPYIQDLIEGESPVDTVLAEYGVDEDAETQLLTIRRGDLVNSVSINGTLEYANRERLSFGTSGTIDTIDVEVGDFVSEGDILMSLEAEAIVNAEQNLQTASVALQDAEDKLEDLVSPDDKAISDATLTLLKAYQTLADAEDAYDSILEPSDADIAKAELEIAKATAAVEDADAKLADLRSPADIDLENARLAVVETEKSLSQLVRELEDLTSQKSVDIRNAQLAVNEAAKAHDDAIEAYQRHHQHRPIRDQPS